MVGNPFDTGMLRDIVPLSLLGLLPLPAATISFQEGVGPTSGYDHISKDIRSEPASNNGAQTLVGNQPAGVGRIRTLMSFALSAIPAGSTINSISLTLVTDSQNQGGNMAGVGVINLHEIIPGGIAANNMIDGSTWSNWSSTGTWTTPGGDYDPTALTSSTLNDANANGRLEYGDTAVFSSTPAFVAAAQAAFDAGLPLEFILIAPTAEAGTSGQNFFRFVSDNHATTNLRPLLAIDYTIPEPSTAAFALLSAALLARRSRRR
jgi:hypothetical protein